MAALAIAAIITAGLAATGSILGATWIAHRNAGPRTTNGNIYVEDNSEGGNSLIGLPGGNGGLESILPLLVIGMMLK